MIRETSAHPGLGPAYLRTVCRYRCDQRNAVPQPGVVCDISNLELHSPQLSSVLLLLLHRGQQLLVEAVAERAVLGRVQNKANGSAGASAIVVAERLDDAVACKRNARAALTLEQSKAKQSKAKQTSPKS